MDTIDVVEKVMKVLEFVNTLSLKPNEKIVVLKTAVSAIENVISMETMTMMTLNYLKGSVK